MDFISCPFCNAALPLDDLHQTGGKVPCVRCGEPLPSMLVEKLSTIPADPPTLPVMLPTWTNRAIALSVIGIMVLMAAIGLTLALSTIDARRKNDYRVKKSTTPSSTLQAPGELTALGFLPPEVNLAAAVQVAELLKDSEGKKLLETPRPQVVDLLLAAVGKWTGLKAEGIDQIVLGTEVRDKLPQLTVVVETRLAYDPAALAKALQPTVPTLQRGKILYRFSLQPGEAMLWCPQPRTLVFLFRLDALKITDLEAVPLMPRTGGDAPPPILKDILGQRVNKQSLVWIAGEFKEADALKELLPLAPLPPSVVRLLTNINAVGLSLFSQEGLVLVGHFRTGAEAKTRLLQKQLEELSLPGIQAKVVASLPGVTDVAAQWVTLQMRGTPQAFRDLLGQWGR